MTERKPFRPANAQEAFPEGAKGDFMVPYCVPGTQILMGSDVAVIVVPTQDGQRVGLPMDLQTVSDLHELLGEALRTLQAPEGGTVQ